MGTPVRMSPVTLVDAEDQTPSAAKESVAAVKDDAALKPTEGEKEKKEKRRKQTEPVSI